MCCVEKTFIFPPSLNEFLFASHCINKCVNHSIVKIFLSFLELGVCPYGASCTFAHGKGELIKKKSSSSSLTAAKSDPQHNKRTSTNSGTPTASTSGAAAKVNKVEDAKKDPNLYKTQLCEAFFKNGKCSEGHHCFYAHGRGDQRVLSTANS